MTSRVPIKVLMVEDSKSVQLALAAMIETDARLQLIGAVKSGEEALKFLEEQKPDVVLMDIHLPGMNGFEATRQIMSTKPLPIVICSATSDPDDVAATFQAIDAGALALIAKPAGPLHPNHEGMKQHLLDTLRLMSEVRVIRRWPRGGRASARAASMPRNGAFRLPAPGRVVAIGASTGGPPVLRSILCELPQGLLAPVLVVQHIAPGFLGGLVEWLQQSCVLPLHVATHGEQLASGHVYFAPDGRNMGVDPQGRVALSPGVPGSPLCPSVAHLFHSVADIYGSGAIGVLLTGMGKDGAQELALLKGTGATTIAQDKATSVVHGMPGEAIRLGAATQVLPADEIGGVIKRLLLPP